MAAKAVGKTYGVAKKANLVIVKIPVPVNKRTPILDLFAWIDAMNLIYQDAQDHGTFGRSVLNIGYTCKFFTR